MTRPLYLDPDLADSDVVILGGAEGRHAATVRRTQPGEQIDVANGQGLRLTIEVEAVAKSEVRGKVVRRLQEEPPRIHLTIVQGLAKGGRSEQAVETCTEFGADAFIPWMSERAIVRWDAARAGKGRAKWQDTAWAAAKQSRRAFVPRVEPVVTSPELAQLVAEFPGKVFLCHEEASQRLVDVLPHTPGPEQIMVIIGPEGGISPAEVDALTQAGASPVLLGAHVLRSATAGAWASAVIRAKLG
ncbi:16S rRNA (uracil(1498)-N(3))-methyltransferase [Trueperella bialowiezensis]|uniref:Ribosomal RNA small subunit methyltransferase E n=1 Tax=Trueperella bialowiezensis TaxID=312285 RepID=A0A448PGL8_9ACTO|nr:16S rRNA (uracil(1498)-N(3))-methyltransferase [Trueperella bialowiezensis]VEI14109.1 Ribosomal RNA small subunit methyltransferase E [Trueperella bialowiezensis]